MSSTTQNYLFRLTPYTAFVKGLVNVNSNDFAISDESDSDIGCNDLHVLTSPHINSLTDEKEFRIVASCSADSRLPMLFSNAVLKALNILAYVPMLGA